MLFFPVTRTRIIAFVFAVFAARPYNLSCRLSFPSTEIFPASVIKFTNASFVLLHFTTDFVDGNAAAKVVTIMKAPSRGP